MCLSSATLTWISCEHTNVTTTDTRRYFVYFYTENSFSVFPARDIFSYNRRPVRCCWHVFFLLSRWRGRLVLHVLRSSLTNMCFHCKAKGGGNACDVTNVLTHFWDCAPRIFLHNCINLRVWCWLCTWPVMHNERAVSVGLRASFWRRLAWFRENFAWGIFNVGLDTMYGPSVLHILQGSVHRRSWMNLRAMVKIKFIL